MKYDFETLVVSEPRPYLLHVEINRPSKRNSMNDKFWVEFRECFERISQDTRARVVIISGKAEWDGPVLLDEGLHGLRRVRPPTERQKRHAKARASSSCSVAAGVHPHPSGPLASERKHPASGDGGRKQFAPCSRRFREDGLTSNDVHCFVVPAGDHFSAGLDIAESTNIGRVEKITPDVARRAFLIRNVAKAMQASINAVEWCPQPVVAAVHGFCIGAGVDLMCACDVRLCSSDATFSVAEARLGLAADLGTLQRMPRIVGNESLCRELAYTGRTFDAAEAAAMGLVSRVLAPKSGRDEVVEASLQLATEIARNSPVAVAGTKRNFLYGRDHSVEDGMEYNVTWNMSALQTEDLGRAMRAGLKKGGMPPKFSKL